MPGSVANAVLTGLLVFGYLGACEGRAPDAWKVCEPRWNYVMGVFVPSPLQAMAAFMRRRRQADERDEQSTPPNA